MLVRVQLLRVPYMVLQGIFIGTNQPETESRLFRLRAQCLPQRCKAPGRLQVLRVFLQALALSRSCSSTTLRILRCLEPHFGAYAGPQVCVTLLVSSRGLKFAVAQMGRNIGRPWSTGSRQETWNVDLHAQGFQKAWYYKDHLECGLGRFRV